MATDRVRNPPTLLRIIGSIWWNIRCQWLNICLWIMHQYLIGGFENLWSILQTLVCFHKLLVVILDDTCVPYFPFNQRNIHCRLRTGLVIHLPCYELLEIPLFFFQQCGFRLKKMTYCHIWGIIFRISIRSTFQISKYEKNRVPSGCVIFGAFSEYLNFTKVGKDS